MGARIVIPDVVCRGSGTFSMPPLAAARRGEITAWADADPQRAARVYPLLAEIDRLHEVIHRFTSRQETMRLFDGEAARDGVFVAGCGKGLAAYFGTNPTSVRPFGVPYEDDDIDTITITAQIGTLNEDGSVTWSTIEGYEELELDKAEVWFDTLQPWDDPPPGYNFLWVAPGALWAADDAGKLGAVQVRITFVQPNTPERVQRWEARIAGA